MEKITQKSHPKEWAIIKKVLPNYRKRSAYIHRQSSVSLYGRYWDGGSRTVWYIVRGSLVEIAPSRNDSPLTAPDIEINLDNQNDGVTVMVVSSGTFCGKPATASLYLAKAILYPKDKSLLPHQKLALESIKNTSLTLIMPKGAGKACSV